MKPRYSTLITRKEASAYLRAYFGHVRLPAGARYRWVAGVQWPGDVPGSYLRSAAGGLEGVVIIAPCAEAHVEQVREVA